MARSSPLNYGSYGTRPGTGNTDFDEINKPDPSTFGSNSLANRAAQPVGGGAAPAAGAGTQTANGSLIGQSPMNPAAVNGSTPTQTPNYATRPGTGNTDFGAINKPDPSTFGSNSLANRAARPVGRSMSDPQRQMEVARRNAVANGDMSGAAQLAGQMGQPQQNAGAAEPPMAGGGVQTPNGSKIGQSPMNPSAMMNNDATHTYNYAERPGQGARGNTDDWDAAVDPSRVPFGKNSLANRAARPVGRSMSDPQRQAEMARRDAVANGGMSGAGDDEETPPGRAKGGPVEAGRPYLVGEEGPEIIVPKQSGTVVPNHKIVLAHGGGRAKAARQTRGLFMSPRPVPAEFARQYSRRRKA